MDPIIKSFSDEFQNIIKEMAILYAQQRPIDNIPIFKTYLHLFKRTHHAFHPEGCPFMITLMDFINWKNDGEHRVIRQIEGQFLGPIRVTNRWSQTIRIELSLYSKKLRL